MSQQHNSCSVIFVDLSPNGYICSEDAVMAGQMGQNLKTSVEGHALC